jgi:hypothetical protein
MKTTTYLRYSLLVPFVIWGICLLVILTLNATAADQPSPELPESITMGISIFFTAYVLGIIFWIFPYLLLGLILFFSTFIVRARTALMVFALSPVAMTLLTIATVIIIDLGNSGVLEESYSYSNFMGFVAILVLGWGYICVGLGYGIYKLLQGRGKIRDEDTLQASVQPV